MLRLTTPSARCRCVRAKACPVKDEFDRKARDYVGELEWVKEVRAHTGESVPMGVTSSHSSQ